MPTLIHLNGPSGVGKSTLAQRYVEEHPGVLNLDIDTVVTLIGGWRENFFGVVPQARLIAIAMAEAHLQNGRDVVMPQLMTDVGEGERVESAARRADAEYIEIALTVELAELTRRFRTKAKYSELNTQVERAVTAEGGSVRCVHDRAGASNESAACLWCGVGASSGWRTRHVMAGG